MDYGKFKYETALKAREARRNQQQTVIKEMKLRPKIDPHDYETKKGHVGGSCKAGDKVKVTIMFRGREQSRPELGFRLLRKLAEEITELGFVESSPKQDGRNMIMVIAPHRPSRPSASAEPSTGERPPATRYAGRPTSTRPRQIHVRRVDTMPKQKTPHRHGQASQGDRLGQARRASAPASATSSSSSPTRTRRLAGTVEVAKADVKRVKKMLGPHRHTHFPPVVRRPDNKEFNPWHA